MIPHSDKKKNKLKPGLYVVSTPIGNLRDISLRCLDILRDSDTILCEDTRVAQKILNKYDIKKKLISNHKFNEKRNLPKILEILKKNKSVSIITDAGTPSVSDPGNLIVLECIKNSIDIFPIPGPSAVTSAVSVSGFVEKYYFYGFFPEKEKNIKNDLEDLSKIDSSIVFFISPNKINKIIVHLKKYFAGRKILICREMTKVFEEYTRCDIDELETYESTLKGEITIVVSGKKRSENRSNNLEESDKKKIRLMINKNSVKDIVNLIHKERNISKKKIYDFCIREKK
ncbi:16S rRNA (cytidine(1402)-2'-O)-methyltransferase [Candidatus Pelagibacter sp.]|nr:16S rRNA (cytidine(1402)-2'-O)-methyltransferase [Candidatus Pelagibacter sp.]